MNQAALQLIEGGKDVRDKFIGNVEVLDKVKTIKPLANTEFFTVEMVANYYEVEIQVIQRVCIRHRSELESDGLTVLKGEGLRNLRTNVQPVHLKAKNHLTIITRRAVLRIGMFLTDSVVAEKIRTHLLDVKSREENGWHSRRWTREEEDIVLDTIISFTRNNKSLTEALEEIGDKLDRSPQSCGLKWRRDIKYRAPENILKAILDNKGTKIKITQQEIKNHADNDNYSNEKSNEKIDTLLSIVSEQLSLYKEENNKYQHKQEELSNKVFQLQGELYAAREILSNQDKAFSLLESTIKDRDDHIMRVIKERDSAEAKAKRWQKKFKELEVSVQVILKTVQGNQDKLLPQQPKMMQSEPSKPLQRFKQDRNGNLTEIK